MRRAIILLTCTSLFALDGRQAYAQWSDDPALNLAIADRTGEQIQAKARSTPDGGAYVSWFDNSAGGYDVYLQRLDAGGNELWPHNGVLIADRGFSSTQDYDLDLDTAGNALLTFRDDRPGGTQVTATKVDGDGTQVWGATGIQLTSGSDFVAAPKITGTSDGSSVVAWTNNSDVRLQKLDGSGTAQWGAGVTVPAIGGDSTSASDLDASSAGGAILSMVRFGPRTLYAQKFDTAGNELWGASPLAVFDGGSLQFGNFPQFVPDGSGGAAFTWYSTSAGLQCHAQWVQAGGTEAFGHNGVTVSTVPRDRTQPEVSFNAGASQTFVFWREEGGGSTFGIYGQKFDASGVRLWGAGGVEVEALSTNELTQVSQARVGDGAVVSWVETISFGDQRIHASRLAGDGSFVWPATIDVSTVASGKSRLASVSSAGNAVVAVWSDGRNDANDVYGQRIRSDGTLGSDVTAVPAISEIGMLLLVLLTGGAGVVLLRRRG